MTDWKDEYKMKEVELDIKKKSSKLSINLLIAAAIWLIAAIVWGIAS